MLLLLGSNAVEGARGSIGWTVLVDLIGRQTYIRRGQVGLFDLQHDRIGSVADLPLTIAW